MMDDNLLSRIKRELNSQHYFMNNDWFVECVEYYISTHQKAKDNEIINFVKSQWQLSDLREINNENGCLPPDIIKKKVVTLTGKYILQMEKMYDTSMSKYKQLEQIRNISTANIEATENEEKQTWEPKKKRMFYMHLTDGVQNITAMEYKTVTCLHDGMLPGDKIIILGPMQCRRGVLLLEEGKIREIGGEVDSLLIPNALENVLARALNLPENPNPYGTNNSGDNQMNNNQNENIVQNDNLFQDDFEIDLDVIHEIEHSNQEKKEHHNSKLRKMDSLKIKQTAGPSTSEMQYENEVLDFNDDEIFEILDDDMVVSSVPQESTKSQNEQQKLSPLPANQQSTSEMEMDLVDDFDISDFDLTCNAPQITVPNVDNEATKAVKSHANSENTLKSNSLSNKINKSRINHEKPSNSNTTTSPYRTSIFESMTKTDSSSTGSSKNTLSKKNDKSGTSKSRSQGGFVASPNTSALKRPSSQEGLKGNKGERKISDFIQKIAMPAKPEIPKICDFICDVLAQNITEVTFRTIRGQTVRLGKLSKKDQCWQLEATITDRTASLDVTFSSKVLEEIIGLSVKEFSEKKKLAKGNPEKDEELRKYFRNAEAKLEKMDALLELELTASNAKPRVVKITSLTSHQKDVIDKRLKMLKI